jgi:hypothetical protein
VIWLGIDPGATGALARWDGSNLHVFPMPSKTVGDKERTRVDEHGLWQLIEFQRDTGATDAVVEEVSTRPDQGSLSTFTFGYAFGVTYGMLVAAGLRVHPVKPQRWKTAMRVPGKTVSGKKPDEIITRASELFPAHASLFRGPRGGKLFDNAEAALLAAYGERYCK